jgi:hypothetical protein
MGPVGADIKILRCSLSLLYEKISMSRVVGDQLGPVPVNEHKKLLQRIGSTFVGKSWDNQMTLQRQPYKKCTQTSDDCSVGMWKVGLSSR